MPGMTMMNSGRSLMKPAISVAPCACARFFAANALWTIIYKAKHTRRSVRLQLAALLVLSAPLFTQNRQVDSWVQAPIAWGKGVARTGCRCLRCPSKPCRMIITKIFIVCQIGAMHPAPWNVSKASSWHFLRGFSLAVDHDVRCWFFHRVDAQKHRIRMRQRNQVTFHNVPIRPLCTTSADQTVCINFYNQ